MITGRHLVADVGIVTALAPAGVGRVAAGLAGRRGDDRRVEVAERTDRRGLAVAAVGTARDLRAGAGAGRRDRRGRRRALADAGRGVVICRISADRLGVHQHARFQQIQQVGVLRGGAGVVVDEVHRRDVLAAVGVARVGRARLGESGGKSRLGRAARGIVDVALDRIAVLVVAEDGAEGGILGRGEALPRIVERRLFRRCGDRGGRPAHERVAADPRRDRREGDGVARGDGRRAAARIVRGHFIGDRVRAGGLGRTAAAVRERAVPVVGIDGVRRNAVHHVAAAVLPHTVGAGVGAGGVVLRDPAVPLVIAGVGQVVAPPVEVRVDAGEVARRLDGVAEDRRELIDRRVAAGLHRAVLQIVEDRQRRIVPLQEADDVLRLAGGLVGRVGIGVEIHAVGDAEAFARRDVVRPLAVVLAGVVAAVADADDREVDLRGDGVPVDRALMGADVDAEFRRIGRAGRAAGRAGGNAVAAGAAHVAVDRRDADVGIGHVGDRIGAVEGVAAVKILRGEIAQGVAVARAVPGALAAVFRRGVDGRFGDLDAVDIAGGIVGDVRAHDDVGAGVVEVVADLDVGVGAGADEGALVGDVGGRLARAHVQRPGNEGAAVDGIVGGALVVGGVIGVHLAGGVVDRVDEARQVGAPRDVACVDRLAVGQTLVGRAGVVGQAGAPAGDRRLRRPLDVGHLVGAALGVSLPLRQRAAERGVVALRAVEGAGLQLRVAGGLLLGGDLFVGLVVFLAQHREDVHLAVALVRRGRDIAAEGVRQRVLEVALEGRIGKTRLVGIKVHVVAARAVRHEGIAGIDRILEDRADRVDGAVGRRDEAPQTFVRQELLRLSVREAEDRLLAQIPDLRAVHDVHLPHRAVTGEQDFRLPRGKVVPADVEAVLRRPGEEERAVRIVQIGGVFIEERFTLSVFLPPDAAVLGKICSAADVQDFAAAVQDLRAVRPEDEIACREDARRQQRQHHDRCEHQSENAFFQHDRSPPML